VPCPVLRTLPGGAAHALWAATRLPTLQLIISLTSNQPTEQRKDFPEPEQGPGLIGQWFGENTLLEVVDDSGESFLGPKAAGHRDVTSEKGQVGLAMATPSHCDCQWANSKS
jgi:hypothetical protein